MKGRLPPQTKIVYRPAPSPEFTSVIDRRTDHKSSTQQQMRHVAPSGECDWNSKEVHGQSEFTTLQSAADEFFNVVINFSAPLTFSGPS